MIDTRQLVSQLRLIESVAVISRVASTNTLARRVVAECIENDLPLPSAVIVAREQLEGRGRGDRRWLSPRGAGIYATVLHSRKLDQLATLPLQVAVILANFLRRNYGIEARIKWPNDILVEKKKIAGILIEARTQKANAYAAIGVGVNVTTVPAELAPMATSIEEASGRETGTDDAATRFIRSIDTELTAHAGTVVEEWSSLTVHRRGDSVTFHTPAGELTGTWQQIDGYGRAVVATPEGLRQISAADLIMSAGD